MTPVKLATVGIIAAGAMFGALSASAAPISTLGSIAKSDSSMVEQVGYRNRCWYSYGHRYCKKSTIAPTPVVIIATTISDLIGGLKALREIKRRAQGPAFVFLAMEARGFC